MRSMPTLFESESLESKAVPFNMREFNDLSVSLRKPKDSGLTDQFKRKIQINEEDVDQLRLRKKQSTNLNSGEKSSCGTELLNLPFSAMPLKADP